VQHGTGVPEQIVKPTPLDPYRATVRCRKCVLPSNFPGIAFDESGTCSLCRLHQPIRTKGEDALRRELDRYRITSVDRDCVVMLSGGRDSVYVLHQIVRKFGMRALAMTYDNGLLSHVAQENMQRATSILDVPHLVISANKEQVRDDLRRNFLAWLAKPALGMIPLFMVSGKLAERRAAQLSKKRRIPLIIDGTAEIERTAFKTAFLGVSDTALGEVPPGDFGRLAARYVWEYVVNPRYLNPSVLRAVRSFLAFFVLRRFLLRRNLLLFYDYVQWDEERILHTIRSELGWESSPDTSTTWRTDDRASALYNWLYYILVGFTEHDALYSNLVREGLLDRETALARLQRDNQPRMEAVRDFLSYIGVNQAPEEIERVLVCKFVRGRSRSAHPR
jgi:glucosamine--fructose-6-phosphate aminotransferase (isomerizing)